MADIIHRFKRFKDKAPPKEVDGSDLLITKDDITLSENELDIMARTILYERRITKTRFTKIYNAYMENVTKLAPSMKSSSKDNLLKAVYRGRLTFYAFKSLMNVLGVEISVIQLKGKDGYERTFTMRQG